MPLTPALSRIAAVLPPAAIALAVAVPAAAQAPNQVTPYLECVDFLPDNVFQIHFGYASTYPTDVTIDVGPQNFFSPGVLFRGQPTTFLPGEHHDVFSTTFNVSGSFSRVNWFVDGSFVGDGWNTARLCSVTPRGTWDASTTYQAGDLVRDRVGIETNDLRLFVYYEPCALGTPTSNNNCWMPYAPMPPAIAPIANQTTPENTPLPPIPFTISDPDSSFHVKVSAESSDPALIPVDRITIAGWADNRTIAIAPAANRSGSATITLHASDGLNVAQTQFVVKVGAVNSAPTISSMANVSTDEDTITPALAFTVDDPDTDVASLTVTATSSNPALVPVNQIVFGGTGAARTVTLTPLPDANGTSTITVTVSDGTLTASTSFTLTVREVDDPPRMMPIAHLTTVENTPTPPIPLIVTDVDSDDDAIIVVPVSQAPWLVPSDGVFISGYGPNRKMTITPASNQTGTTFITLMISDGKNATFSSVTITVTPGPAQPEPTPEKVYYLAEGSTGAFFDLDILIANPSDTAVPATVTFLKETGTPISLDLTLAPSSRMTIPVDQIPGLESTGVSTVVTSKSGLPLVVERTMWWDKTHYGSHTEKATSGAANTWFFAEGSQGFFSTYFLLVNPQNTTNTAHVTYLREGEAVLARDYTLPPQARVTIDAGADPELKNRSFGAEVQFDRPGGAERAMYFGPNFAGGTDSAGVTAPSTDWFLAEGATGSFFTTFVLLANPGIDDATATLTYLPSNGVPVVRTHVVPAKRRLTINIADEVPSLADAVVATKVSATVPILVERSQYWPKPVWEEGHNSFGETALGTHWGLAEGRVGGANNCQTFVLLANPGSDAATVTVKLLRAAGAPITKTFIVAPTSRFTVAITGPGSDVSELANESFGADITSTQPIMVERAMYSDANGIVWAAGSNATGTRLP